MDPQAKHIRWDKFPFVCKNPQGKEWLEIQQLLGLASNTVEAYGRGLEQFLGWCQCEKIMPTTATRPDIARYVGYLRQRPGANPATLLSNATLQQRLTVIRLFFDYLVEEELRKNNPVGRGHYSPRGGFGGGTRRGLVRRLTHLPWIPSDEDWMRLLRIAQHEPVRNRFMLALAYDAALRREELCSIRTEDIDPAHRLVRIRAETSKSNQDRIVPYSQTTGVLFSQYLAHRRHIARRCPELFVSESRRNFGKPISFWTWSKVVRRIADTAGLAKFSTHTLRHLCLTDLARSGWDIHEIAQLAGHRHLSSTHKYIHLSGRDLSEKFARNMDQIHEWRTSFLANHKTPISYQ